MTPPVPRQPLLMLDYDGTLAEIVAEPSEAFAHPGAAALLTSLAERYPLYIVTGRKVDDLGALLNVPRLEVVGVHGMERGRLGGEIRPLAPKEALADLDTVRERLPELDGLRVEDKGLAIALHYRNAPDESAALETLQGWAEALPGSLKALWGKKVLEIRPGGYSKGQIARQLADEHPDATPVFIGDDTTDEEAFAALQGGVTIKVGQGETEARYRLADVSAVIGYLRAYL